MDEEEIKIKMDDCVARFNLHSLRGKSFYLLTCLEDSLVLRTRNEIVVELPCEG